MRQLHLTASGRLDAPALFGDAPLRHVLAVLNPDGEETRLVGGVVRNALLGLPPGDIDLATTMPPAEVGRRAKAARLRVVPTGLAHGTVTVLAAGRPFEVTTLREDVETDGRHALVRFGRDFALDAQRRDFTMNALSLGPEGRVFDTVGGVEDLREGRVRFIGDAGTRIREDYLRILRFFRFHAAYALGALDAEGARAARANRDGLARLSRERVRVEILKILMAPGAVAVLDAMEESGVLGFVVPPPVDVARLRRLVGAAPGEADATLRLAALALDGPGRIEALRGALRLTNAETKRLDAADRCLRDLDAEGAPPDETRLLRLLHRHGREASLDALALHCAGRPAGDGADADRAALLRTAAVPTPPFGSADLMARGLRGPALGAALTRLREAWAEAGFPADAPAIEALLDTAAS